MEYQRKYPTFPYQQCTYGKTNLSKYWNQKRLNSLPKYVPSYEDPYLRAARIRNKMIQNRMVVTLQKYDIKDEKKDEKKDGKKRNILKIFFEWMFAIFCILGMLYQCENTTDGYLQYATTSEVNIKLEYQFDSPAVGLCFNPVAFRTDETCPFNASFGEMRACYTENMLYDMKLIDIIGNLSVDLISRVSNENNEFEIETFFKWRACLDINQREIKTNLAKITKGNASARKIFEILINFTGQSVKEFSIELHDSELKPRGIYIKTLDLLLDDEVRNAYRVGYQGVVVNLLPYPFKDECIDYKNLEFESHFHCMDRCVNGKLYEKYKKYHPYLLQRSAHYDEGISFINISAINYSEYYSSCEKSCPQNCHSKTYNTIPVDNWIRDENKTLNVIVDYLESNIAITYQARLNFEEYIIYIASILSLWFGWCIHTTPVHVIQSIKSIKFRGKRT